LLVPIDLKRSGRCYKPRPAQMSVGVAQTVDVRTDIWFDGDWRAAY
jgi:hypothetical protein